MIDVLTLTSFDTDLSHPKTLVLFVCFFDVVVSVLRGFIPFKVQGNYLFSFHLTSSNTVYSLHTGTVGGCVET